MATSKNLVDLNIPSPKLPEVDRYLAAASALRIDTGADFLSAQEVRAGVNKQIAELNEQRMEITRPMDAAKKKIMDLFNTPISTLTRALGLFDGKLIAYDRAQQAKREAEQRKADQDAETERLRLQEIANAAAAKGQDAKALRFQERAQTTVAPIIQADAPRAAGVSIRKSWDFEITDPNGVRRAYCRPDEVKIGKLVRAAGREAQDLVGPGVRIFEDMNVASRRT